MAIYIIFHHLFLKVPHIRLLGFRGRRPGHELRHLRQRIGEATKDENTMCARLQAREEARASERAFYYTGSPVQDEGSMRQNARADDLDLGFAPEEELGI